MSDGIPYGKFLCCHIRSATSAVAIIVMVAAFLGMIASVVLGLQAGGFKGLLQVVIGLFICFAKLIFAGLLLIGVKRRSGGFLVVYMVWQVLSVIGWLIVLTIAGVALAATAALSTMEKDAVNKKEINREGFTLITYMAICVLLTVTGIIFFAIVLRCFLYFRDLRILGDGSGVSLSLIG